MLEGLPLRAVRITRGCWLPRAAAAAPGRPTGPRTSVLSSEPGCPEGRFSSRETLCDTCLGGVVREGKGVSFRWPGLRVVFWGEERGREGVVERRRVRVRASLPTLVVGGRCDGAGRSVGRSGGAYRAAAANSRPGVVERVGGGERLGSLCGAVGGWKVRGRITHGCWLPGRRLRRRPVAQPARDVGC